MVEIFDGSALNNRGYKFNFFLESNVRNNKELKSEFVPLKTTEFQKNSFLCDLSNRNSAEVTINVLDTINSNPLEDVAVSVKVADESCYIGSTDENGILTAKFPAGTAGAVLSLAKPDYLSKSQLFDAKLDEKTSVSLELAPITDKRIMIKKKLLEKINEKWEFTNKISDLGQNEEAIVTLTRLSLWKRKISAPLPTSRGRRKRQSGWLLVCMN